MVPFIALFVFYLFVFLLTPNQIFSFDAVTNAIACESNEFLRWFHGSHPLYPFLGVLWYRMEKFFGYTGYSIYSLARFNSLLMALALSFLFFNLSKEIGKGRSFVISSFLGSTYAVWHYAVDGRAVGASVFFAGLVIGWLMRLNRFTAIEPKHTLILAGLSTLYILVHGIAIFHVVPISLWIHQNHQWPKARKMSFLYIATVLSLCFLFCVGLQSLALGGGGWASFFQWMFGYVGHEGFSNALQGRYWSKSLGNFLVGIGSGWTKSIVNYERAGPFRLFSQLLAAGAFLVLCWSGVNLRFISEDRRKMAHCLFLWGGLTTLFLGFWSPGQEGFRLHVLLPWFVGAALLFDKEKIPFWILSGIAAFIFLINLNYSIYPASFIQNNQGFQLMKELRKHMREGDLFLSAQTGVVPDIEVLRPYFFSEVGGGSVTGRLFAFREKSLLPLSKSVEKTLTRGNNVYMSMDIFDESVQKLIEGERGLRKGEFAQFAFQFKPVNHFYLANGIKVVQVSLKEWPKTPLSKLSKN